MKGPGIHRAGPRELAVLDRVGREESRKLVARKHARAALPSVPSTTWVNLGPTDAPQEFNYYTIAGVDSGRPNNIVVDPKDANIVYVAVSGGGVWKTYNFLSDSPVWAPTMDTMPNLAVGSLAMDSGNSSTLFVGTGDFVDGSGDTIFKSSDGGGTWNAGVVLEGTYPAPDNSAVHARSIRSIAAAGNIVFAGTDVGLFGSTDGGATFSLVDLPNANADNLSVAEEIWRVIPTGGAGWTAIGVGGCDVGSGPPSPFGGPDPDPANCKYGNNTAIWHTDDGTTWTASTGLPLAAGTNRGDIAAGPTSDAAKTVVYAFIGDNGGSATIAFWRSDDAGVTWVDASGTLANPTVPYPIDPQGDLGNDCGDLDVGHGQTWYNQAITVDPTNADHVLVGGNLCGMRTLNGTSDAPTWELVSHWLPSADPNNLYGNTANGILPYVHADWHTAASVVMNGKVKTFAGTDGGIFSSDDVFDDATQAEKVTWENHNHGLATHLLYSVASGDPAAGDPFVAFAGLQDNGTRFRADPKNPGAFNQPVGGDGIGATVHHSTSGTTYFGSVEFQRVFCKPAVNDCSVEVPEADDVTLIGHWHGIPSLATGEKDQDEIEERWMARAKLSHEDSEPFLEHYADVETDTTGQSVLTHTDSIVFVTSDDGAGGIKLTPISQDVSDAFGGGISNVTAARGTAGLYGAAGAVSREPFYYTTSGNTPSTWKIAQAVHPDGTANRLTGPSYIDFPPSLPSGKNPGDVFIGAFTGTMNDLARTPPPDDQGHLYRTVDGGATWTSLAGADPAHRLPNVPVYVAKYDPVTPTTIYAGTQLGVYITLDDGATWDRMGDNFPMIPVRDMYVAKNQDFIRVATYGRGMWEIYPSDTAPHGAFGNGDYDRNLKIDWIDLGAMSARLGESPSSTSAPLYSWILDMVGTDADPPVQRIDEHDLGSLLAVFGGHP